MAEWSDDGDPGWLQGWRRRAVIAAGVAGAAVLVGAVLGILLAGRTPGPSQSAAVARLTPLPAGALVGAPGAAQHELDDPVGIGSLRAGVAVLALDEVDQVRTVAGRRRAPEGSSLVAFRLGDWTCEAEPCAPWRSLHPQVVVDGEGRDFPDTGDTFVLVVPPGSDTVDLVVDEDGFRQSISLTDGRPGADNIALLAERGTERRVPLNQTFPVTEHTSVALDDGAGGRADTFTREVGVEYAQLRFFLHGEVPSAPDKAFLVVNAYYSYAGQSGRFVLGPGEATFIDADGNRYDARDLDPAPDKGLLGFEVPATVRSGVLEIGGSTDKVSTTGVPYVSTLAGRQVPISLG
jgi:hypothetical protein